MPKTGIYMDSGIKDALASISRKEDSKSVIAELATVNLKPHGFHGEKTMVLTRLWVDGSLWASARM